MIMEFNDWLWSMVLIPIFLCFGLGGIVVGLEFIYNKLIKERRKK